MLRDWLSYTIAWFCCHSGSDHSPLVWLDIGGDMIPFFDSPELRQHFIEGRRIRLWHEDDSGPSKECIVIACDGSWLWYNEAGQRYCVRWERIWEYQFLD
jgi:hypothetical protein